MAFTSSDGLHATGGTTQIQERARRLKCRWMRQERSLKTKREGRRSDRSKSGVWFLILHSNETLGNEGAILLFCPSYMNIPRSTTAVALVSGHGIAPTWQDASASSNTRVECELDGGSERIARSTSEDCNCHLFRSTLPNPWLQPLPETATFRNELLRQESTVGLYLALST